MMGPPLPRFLSDVSGQHPACHERPGIDARTENQLGIAPERNRLMSSSLWFQGQVQAVLRQAGGPLLLVRGEGSRVWDDRGRAYLDARSGLWAVTVGYSRPEVAAAVDDQLR